MNRVNDFYLEQAHLPLPVVMAIKLDALHRNQMILSKKIKTRPPLHRVAAFSLVEVTLALGVAAFALLAILGMMPTTLKTQQTSIQQTTSNAIITSVFADLRADMILPPGQYRHLEEDSGYQLHGHWANMNYIDKLYFTQEGKQTGLSRPTGQHPRRRSV